MGTYLSCYAERLTGDEWQSVCGLNEYGSPEDLYYVNYNRLFRTTSASTVSPGTWTELTTVGTTIDPDGTTHTLGTVGTEDIVWLYIRTGASNSNGQDQHTWQPTGGIPLTSPLVVSGDQSRTMVFDFSGRTGDEDNGFGGWQCGCDAPTMSFR